MSNANNIPPEPQSGDKEYTDQEIIDWLNNNRWATKYFTYRCDIRDAMTILMNGYKSSMFNVQIDKLFE